MKIIKTKEVFVPNSGVNITRGKLVVLRLHEKLTENHAGYIIYNTHILDSYISKNVRNYVHEVILNQVDDIIHTISGNIQNKFFMFTHNYPNKPKLNKSAVLKGLRG